MDPRDPLCLLLKCKQDIRFVLKKVLHSVLILELRRDLNIRMALRKKPDRFRQKINRLPYRQADRNIILILCIEVLSLLYRTFHLFPHIRKVGDKLGACRSKRGPFSTSFKYLKAHFICNLGGDDAKQSGYNSYYRTYGGDIDRNIGIFGTVNTYIRIRNSFDLDSSSYSESETEKHKALNRKIIESRTRKAALVGSFFIRCISQFQFF